MKEFLRGKLLETRKEFLNLKGYKNYKMFLLEINLEFDNDNNIIIVIRKLYENENEEYVFFGEKEIIETKEKEIDIFIDLLRYAEDRYGSQFTYAVHPNIYYFYGNEMDTDKFERILKSYDKSFLSGKVGFAISETIF